MLGKCSEEEKDSDTDYDLHGGGKDTTQTTEASIVLSKRARKKLEKRQQWLDTKQERRAKEREKRKRKIEDRKNDPSYSETRTFNRKQLKNSKMSDSDCKVGIAFDLQFESLMNQRDLGKTLKQIMKCYSMNRRLSSPLQLYMTSFEGRVKKEMEKNQGYENWDINFHPERFDSVLPAGKVVYLSSDSDDIVTELGSDTIYIIGGLVDHNQHKGVCYDKAIEIGIPTARLPIDEFISLKTRKVLTVNHVYEIMAAVTQGKSWKEAFLEIIPERKGVLIKQDDEIKEDTSEESKIGKETEAESKGETLEQSDIKQETEDNYKGDSFKQCDIKQETEADSKGDSFRQCDIKQTTKADSITGASLQSVIEQVTEEVKSKALELASDNCEKKDLIDTNIDCPL